MQLIFLFCVYPPSCQLNDIMTMSFYNCFPCHPMKFPRGHSGYVHDDLQVFGRTFTSKQLVRICKQIVWKSLMLWICLSKVLLPGCGKFILHLQYCRSRGKHKLRWHQHWLSERRRMHPWTNLQYHAFFGIHQKCNGVFRSCQQ